MHRLRRRLSEPRSAGQRFVGLAASAQHPMAIPNQHASYDECDTVYMYVARKNVLENREITLILKGEMSFATETRLAPTIRPKNRDGRTGSECALKCLRQGVDLI